jgi:hypothetical protein
VDCDRVTFLPKTVVMSGAKNADFIEVHYAFIEGHIVVQKFEFRTLGHGPLGLGRVPVSVSSTLSNFAFPLAPPKALH